MDQPSLPTVVRAINWGAEKLRGLGLPLVSLEEPSLLDAARRKTLLADFGEAGFLEGLGRLLSSLEEEADLHLLGRFIARSSIVQCLANRLQMNEARRLHPEIGEGEIRRPIFIVGMPRTGTSILHELLAQDPRNRTPLSWEVARPCPPPERATYETDPRIALVDAELAQTDRLIPGFKKIHPMAARLPQECVAMTVHDFASLLFSCEFRVPSYTRWLVEEADLTPVYASHRRMAQLLQWRCPASRWVFKSPGHLWSLPSLLEVYPDAFLVETHRDPIKILASMISLEMVLRSMTCARVEAHAIAREWAELVAVALDRSVEARESGLVKPSRVIDIQFEELKADTIGTVRRIYQRTGLELEPDAEAAMRRFLAENPADKHGRHGYRFADTGLDLAEQRARVNRYQSFYDIPSDKSS